MAAVCIAAPFAPLFRLHRWRMLGPDRVSPENSMPRRIIHHFVGQPPDVPAGSAGAFEPVDNAWALW